jgi:hypothetical protein
MRVVEFASPLRPPTLNQEPAVCRNDLDPEHLTFINIALMMKLDNELKPIIERIRAETNDEYEARATLRSVGMTFISEAIGTGDACDCDGLERRRIDYEFYHEMAEHLAGQISRREARQ